MAGSKRWFPYTCLLGSSATVFGLEADESNTESINADEAELPTPPPTFALPRNVAPRTVVLRNATGNTITGYALTEARYAAIELGATDIITGYTVIRKSPERISRTVINIDTGLTDGDTEAPASP